MYDTMLLLLPIHFPGLSFELYLELAALTLVLLFWAYLFIKALRSHLNTPMIKDTSNVICNDFRSNLPLVSVIIPARNEEDNIEKCLLSVLIQDYPNFEVIAVDDNSEDRTLEIMKEIKSKQGFGEKLKVISLVAKPSGWTGKTWASQQGYKNSGGDILLFTDADSLFEDRHAIELTMRHMLSDNLDALTGIPYLPPVDFWSKIVMPVWNLYSEIFGHGIADANNPKSKTAFVMGSFFMVKKEVFEEIGTYTSVRDEIQEDRAMGNKLKTKHYRIKIFKVDSLISALWSRDLSSLWHGIRRSITPAAMEDKLTIISHQLILLVTMALPFLLLPYNVLMFCISSDYGAQQPSNVISIPNMVQTLAYGPSAVEDQIQNSIPKGQIGFNPASRNEPPLESILFWFNLSLCLLIIATTGIKSVMKYRLVPLYSILCPIGGFFLIVSYAYCTIPLLTRMNTKSIKWRGRSHDLLVKNDAKNKLRDSKEKRSARR